MAEAFLQVLDGVARRIRGRVLGQLAIAGAALVAAAWAAGAAADAFGPGFARAGRVSILLLTLGLPLVAGGQALARARRCWSRAAVARGLEAASVEDRELFVTALAVAQERVAAAAPPDEEQALREGLGRLLLARAGRRSASADPTVLLARHRLLLPAVALGAVGLALLLGGLLSRDFRTGLGRIGWPWANLSYTHIDAWTTPEDADAGAAMAFSARLSGRPTTDVRLLLQMDGQTRTVAMTRRRDGLWQASLPAPGRAVTVRLQAGDALSPPRLLASHFRQSANAIRWPAAFRRPDTPVPGFSAQFPQGASFLWRFQLNAPADQVQIELRQGDRSERIAARRAADGSFSADRRFPESGRWQARVLASVAGRQTAHRWNTLVVGKDLPPVVKLERPPGPEVALSLIDTLSCAITASDDWGLARLGLEMMVDDRKSEVGVVPLDGHPRDGAGAVELAPSRFPQLGPERSVLVWAFAEDTAGQRALSLPVVLDIQLLYEAGPRARAGGGGRPNALDVLISDQRALAGKTLSAGQKAAAAALADEQQALLGRARQLVERR